MCILSRQHYTVATLYPEWDAHYIQNGMSIMERSFVELLQSLTPKTLESPKHLVIATVATYLKSQQNFKLSLNL